MCTLHRHQRVIFTQEKKCQVDKKKPQDVGGLSEVFTCEPVFDLLELPLTSGLDVMSTSTAAD